jgi:hypothetical protein
MDLYDNESVGSIIMQLPFVSTLVARIEDSIGQVSETQLTLNLIEPTFKPANGTIQVEPLEGVVD